MLVMLVLMEREGIGVVYKWRGVRMKSGVLLECEVESEPESESDSKTEAEVLQRDDDGDCSCG
jgi:hypothetical protein